MVTHRGHPLDDGKLAKYVERDILAKLPEGKQEDARETTEQIIEQYDGVVIDALSLLEFAAEKGRFGEFAEKLAEHHEVSLGFVHPDARIMAVVPAALRAQEFFIKCYKELGVEPRDLGR